MQGEFAIYSRAAGNIFFQKAYLRRFLTKNSQQKPFDRKNLLTKPTIRDILSLYKCQDGNNGYEKTSKERRGKVKARRRYVSASSRSSGAERLRLSADVFRVKEQRGVLFGARSQVVPRSHPVLSRTGFLFARR